MDAVAATYLAERLRINRTPICIHVATRLLNAFPELINTLQTEVVVSPEKRMAEVSAERLCELVRAMLLFNLPILADKELEWACSVLSRNGITSMHQTALIRWFFDEVRLLDLSADEVAITQELEQYMLDVLDRLYKLKR